MRTLLKIFLALLLLIAALIFFAPASLLDSGLARASSGKWRLAESTGTLWNGSGMLTHAQGAVLTPLRWRFEPSALLGGAARWQLLADQTTPRLTGTLTFSKKGVGLDGLSLHTSAAVLQPLLPPEMVQALEGTLIIDAPSLLLQEKSQEGRISGRWQNAQMVFQEVPVDLGNITFNIDSRQQGSHSTIHNEGGAVSLDGQFQTDTSGKPTRGTLKITPRPDTPEALLQLLSTTGQPDAQGSYILEME
ncbi:MAG: type II secretion system protein N [Proteobacteria bacterium]|nr:type II secretion system protein N [Pseudomonadota bacterium]MCL2306975.1 type II secretion system protein N [Pseudomonadota bacterium]